MFHSKQKHKVKKQRHLGQTLNERAIHLEVMIQKMKPELRQRKMEFLRRTQGLEGDVQVVDLDFKENQEPVKGIL